MHPGHSLPPEVRVKAGQSEPDPSPIHTTVPTRRARFAVLPALVLCATLSLGMGTGSHPQEIGPYSGSYGLAGASQSDTTAAADSAATVYVTPSGRRYHREHCHHAAHNRGAKAVTLDAVPEINAERPPSSRLSPCRVCKPGHPPAAPMLAPQERDPLP